MRMVYFLLYFFVFCFFVYFEVCCFVSLNNLEEEIKKFSIAQEDFYESIVNKKIIINP